MDSDDLFSFLDDTSAEKQNDSIAVEEQPVSSGKPTHKRKALSNVGPGTLKTQNGDVHMQEPDNEAGPSAPKKMRTASPKPIVLDDFETEAKREVAASAGLTGGVEAGSRLELRHQVCTSLRLNEIIYRKLNPL